ncbi:MAG: hypothetical protein HYZ23_02620 [Chloroflexi bacterium]|nr:hypothetical protein [Chloroflexota bacterium]
MTKQPRKNFHSKSFSEGVEILADEIELARQWNRPAILLAVHASKAGQAEAQDALEREIAGHGGRVFCIAVESSAPDVIRVMSEANQPEDAVFFVSGIDNANQETDGRVYNALNLRRELLVEEKIRAVFWLTESEAAILPRLAPDFWAFRHRVVEFAPKRGKRNLPIPAGLFLWDDSIQETNENTARESLARHRTLLDHLPKEDDSISTRIDSMLALAHLYWILDDSKELADILQDGLVLIGKHPNPHDQARLLNAKAIDLHDRGNKADAGLCFAQAAGYEPANSAILMNNAIVLRGLGKNRDAILQGKRAIKQAAGNSRLWFALGCLLLSMEKVMDAIEAAAKASALSPRNVDARLLTAICRHKMGQSVECARELEKISAPHNALQQACIEALNGRLENVVTQLKSALGKGEIKQHHIQRDPNLFFLLSPAERLEFK